MNCYLSRQPVRTTHPSTSLSPRVRIFRSEHIDVAFIKFPHSLKASYPYLTTLIMLLADEINFTTQLPPSGDVRKHVLIFFIPGNPGLVEYYRQFIDIIRKRLNDQVSNTATQYFISGGSLAGFDVNSGSRQALATSQGLPLSLDNQVEDVYARLQATVTRLRAGNDVQGDLPVVLIGHSIGAYMVLETVAKWKKLSQQGPTNMEITAGLCLFPTIYELNLSPTGRQVGVSTVYHVASTPNTDSHNVSQPLTKIPAFALIVHTIAKILFYFAPLAVVTWLVRLITGMPDTGADVTAQFVQSKYGVWQALHMAKDELAQLTHDKWSDEFWGTSSTISAAVGKSADEKASSSISHTQLYFYWGSNDHWIAQDTRDRIIQTRAKVAGRAGDERKPTMEVDSNGIGHAFCLSESGNQIVAAKCAGWIESLSR
jgi:pimeloyl-ACP methyl ester carboxylesterase